MVDDAVLRGGGGGLRLFFVVDNIEIPDSLSLSQSVTWFVTQDKGLPTYVIFCRFFRRFLDDSSRSRSIRLL